jgi:hypothetical protein
MVFFEGSHRTVNCIGRLLVREIGEGSLLRKAFAYTFPPLCIQMSSGHEPALARLPLGVIILGPPLTSVDSMNKRWKFTHILGRHK